jgi:predicted nucleic acid-binding protein
VVRRALAAAEQVLTSDLTLVECDRALVRAEVVIGLGTMDVQRRRALLGATAAHWMVMPIGPAIIDRARRSFPSEPVRTLDALHLASALSVADVVENLTVLSLDRRVRSSAHALGLRLLPAAVSGR